MSELSEAKAKEIIRFVEDAEGQIRLDNLVREPRYQFAKGFLEGLEVGRSEGEVEKLRSKTRGDSLMAATKELEASRKRTEGLAKAATKVVKERDGHYGENSDIHPEILDLKEALEQFKKAEGL